MNRYYDKRYQSLYANGFGENTKTQNELGFYIGLETNALSKCKLVSYVDFFLLSVVSVSGGQTENNRIGRCFSVKLFTFKFTEYVDKV